MCSRRARTTTSLKLDETAFSDDILRVGFAVNDLIVTEIKKGR